MEQCYNIQSMSEETPACKVNTVYATGVNASTWRGALEILDKSSIFIRAIKRGSICKKSVMEISYCPADALTGIRLLTGRAGLAWGLLS